jgi:hypothetical protein
LKIKLKGPAILIIEAIVGESKVVLNTLTERDFQGTFIKMAGALGTVHTCKRRLLRF